MFCKNCGVQVDPDLKFCKNCGTAIDVPPTKNPQNSIVCENTTPFTPVVEREQTADVIAPINTAPPAPVEKRNFSDVMPPVAVIEGKKGKRVSPALYVILGIVIAAFIGAASFLVYTLVIKDDNASSDVAKKTDIEVQKGIGGGAKKQNDAFLELSVDEVPDKCEENTYNLTGTALVKGEEATLYINGEKAESFEEGEDRATWSYQLELIEGKNEVEIKLENSETEKVKNIVIEYEPKKELLYPAGTVLIKGDPESGVNVRPTPRISEERVMLIEYDDFTSEFVCVGEESTEVNDEGEFIWCRVRTPKGELGWVRSDLMKRKN